MHEQVENAHVVICLVDCVYRLTDAVYIRCHQDSDKRGSRPA